LKFSVFRVVVKKFHGVTCSSLSVIVPATNRASRCPPCSRPRLSSSVTGLDRGLRHPSPCSADLLPSVKFFAGLSPSVRSFDLGSCHPFRPRSASRRPSPTSASLSTSVPGFDRGARGPSAAWAGFSPSALASTGAFAIRPDLGEPFAVHSRFRPGLLPSIPGLGRHLAVCPWLSLGLSPFVPGFGQLVAVHLQLRWGLSPSVPVLGRHLAVRPGLDRGSRGPSPAPTVLFVRLDLTRASTVRHWPWQASRRLPPALTGPFAARPRSRQVSRCPAPASTEASAGHHWSRPGISLSLSNFDQGCCRPDNFSRK